MSIDSTLYLIIGSGRLARHLQEYFKHLRLNYETWNRINGTEQDLLGKLERNHRILLAISDSNLVPFMNQTFSRIPKSENRLWIHFSGAAEVPRALTFHPLMTFSSHPYDLSVYSKIPFVTTSSLSLEQALPGLSNPCYRIAPEQKGLYHALCVIAGNFSTLLWQKLILEFQKMGLPTEVGKEFAKQSVENVFSAPTTSLTGPLARNDFETQNKNLQALGEDPYRDIYLAFQKLHKQLSDSNPKKGGPA